MTPRQENSQQEIFSEASSSFCTTVVVRPRSGGPEYVRCESKDPIAIRNAKEENQKLNLNLGQSIVSPDNKTLLWILRFLSNVLVSWWEKHLFKLYGKIPVRYRRAINMFLWNKFYFPLHKLLLGRKTGIHTDISDQYHAITTLIWGGRFFPVTVERMRFSLAQLSTWTPPPQTRPNKTRKPTPLITAGDYVTDSGASIENIDQDLTDQLISLNVVPDVQKEHCRVKGVFLHRHDKPTDHLCFWLYGGAFLAGDAEGNIGPADVIGYTCDVDVFIPSYRLAPEYTYNDILWDTCLAYKWAVEVRHYDPSKITLKGISSGAGLCMRLMQFFAELERGETLLPSYIAPLFSKQISPAFAMLNGSFDEENNARKTFKAAMPAGAILSGPFVDYTEQPPDGSFHQYSKHDLVVTQAVLRCSLPYMWTHMNGTPKEHSPVHRSMKGLPPICVVISEHETVFDMTAKLVNKARAENVEVTVGMWKYLCHVFLFFQGFIPEGKDAMEFVCDWYNKEKEKTK